ncbi:MAG: RNA polymerase sigma factor [Phycisphaerales bacterium]
MQWETTTILLEQLHDAQDEAWQRFTARFRPPMIRFARRCGLSEEQAEDAAQDTLVQFVERYRDGQYERSRGRLGSWLFTLMYNSIRSQRRDDARSPRQAPRVIDRTTFFSARPDEASAARVWEQDWEHHAISTCIDQLRSEVSPSHFQVFELTTFREVPAAEVARQLGLTRDAVYQARYRVLKRLEELRETFNGVEQLAS